MADASPSIAIIGGGPSGLALARLLEMNGILDYIVFERDTSRDPIQGQRGGTLDLHPGSGQLALQRAGLYEEFSERLARWAASCIHIMGPDGTTAIKHASESREDARPEIDRIQLRGLLLDSIPQHKIRWGHTLRSVEKEGAASSEKGLQNDQYILHFTNGASVGGFRLIVGADGAWSKVRPLLTSAQPLYSGKMFIEGYISQENPVYSAAEEIAGPGNAMAIGGGKMLAVQQMADSTYRMYTGVAVPEDFHYYQSQRNKEDLTQNQSEALRHEMLTSEEFYAKWAPQLKTFIENAKTGSTGFRMWPLYALNPEAIGWKRSDAPGVTLMGDAAHLSTPFVGEGVNCSMHDAVSLADAIVKHCGKGADLRDADVAAKLEGALAEYEEDMFVRGKDLIIRSAASAEVLFSDNACEQFLDFIKG